MIREPSRGESSHLSLLPVLRNKRHLLHEFSQMQPMDVEEEMKYQLLHPRRTEHSQPDMQKQRRKMAPTAHCSVLFHEHRKVPDRISPPSPAPFRLQDPFADAREGASL